ncbi:MAG: aminotransferase class V-fold PLP-dependent enzyme, partial [Chloroflexota bacterium]
MALNLDLIRSKFPGLKRDAIFFDSPAGTQIAQSSIDRMLAYLIESNANHGGTFATSQESDARIDEARQAVADYLNAPRPEEIVFGANMTSLTMDLSRSLATQINPGDTIVVTNLEHDANIAPWALMAEEHGAVVKKLDFDVEDGTLRMDLLDKLLAKKPKLVAVGMASNALGTLNPVKKIIQLAKEVGALTFVDAVQFAPHGPIDVQDLDCDFLTCSPYKFFGPHMGVLFGKYDLLDNLKAYKVRPVPDKPPGKFEVGTPNFEGICGVKGALEYIAWVGVEFGSDHQERYAEKYTGRALQLKKGMAA